MPINRSFISCSSATNHWKFFPLSLFLSLSLAQSAGTVEYTECTSADHPSKSVPGYDTKQSDGKVPVMLEVW